MLVKCIGPTHDLLYRTTLGIPRSIRVFTQNWRNIERHWIAHSVMAPSQMLMPNPSKKLIRVNILALFDNQSKRSISSLSYFL
ncbi:unnamed protein product [Blepharisma stoltei]|uniref:Uncharacterized protein n=1 Tax=Blepharisma stoltei TaxID=1481888 RepID=A0AAU9J524_9CILI|nr:unnamed protein product [Blepharisma stoltei]